MTDSSRVVPDVGYQVYPARINLRPPAFNVAREEMWCPSSMDDPRQSEKQGTPLFRVLCRDLGVRQGDPPLARPLPHRHRVRGTRLVHALIPLIEVDLVREHRFGAIVASTSAGVPHVR